MSKIYLGKLVLLIQLAVVVIQLFLLSRETFVLYIAEDMILLTQPWPELSFLLS